MGFKSRASSSASSSAAVVDFDAIYQRAAARNGGAEELEALLPSPTSAARLSRVPDDRVLSSMAKNIFRAGFVWKIVDAKWPSFEEAFHGFDILRVAAMDEEDLDALATDTRVIRNRSKLAAVRDNARFVFEVCNDWGSFGAYLAKWPEDDLIGLWEELQQRGTRLGGFTRGVFLREVGKDTFLLTGEVVRALIAARIVEKAPTSKRDLRRVQDAFTSWREQTGRPYCQLSKILACSVD